MAASFVLMKLLEKKLNRNFMSILINQQFYDLLYSIWAIGWVFARGPGDLRSIPGRVIRKTKKKIEPDATLLNIQHYKVRVKGKVEQSRERSIAIHYTSV